MHIVTSACWLQNLDESGIKKLLYAFTIGKFDIIGKKEVGEIAWKLR